MFVILNTTSSLVVPGDNCTAINQRIPIQQFSEVTLWPKYCQCTIVAKYEQITDIVRKLLLTSLTIRTLLQTLDLSDNRILTDSIALILESNVSLISISCDFGQDHLWAAIIRTQAPLHCWNRTSLNPEILQVRKNVKIQVLLCSLRTASIGPAS